MNVNRDYFSVKNVALTRANISQLFQKRAVVDVERLDADRIRTIRELLVYEGICERSLRWEHQQKSENGDRQRKYVSTATAEAEPPCKKKSKSNKKAKKKVKKRQSSTPVAETVVPAKKRQLEVVSTSSAAGEMPVLCAYNTDFGDGTTSPSSVSKIWQEAFGIPSMVSKAQPPPRVEVVSTAPVAGLRADVADSIDRAKSPPSVLNVWQKAFCERVPSMVLKAQPVEMTRQWKVTWTATAGMEKTNGPLSEVASVVAANGVARTSCDAPGKERPREVESAATAETEPPGKKKTKSNKKAKKKFTKRKSSASVAKSVVLAMKKKPVQVKERLLEVVSTAPAAAETPVLCADDADSTDRAMSAPIVPDVCPMTLGERIPRAVSKPQSSAPVPIPLHHAPDADPPVVLATPPLVAAPLPRTSVTPPSSDAGPSTASSVAPVARISLPLVGEVKQEPGTVVKKRAAPSVPLVMIPVGNMPAAYRDPKTGTFQSDALATVPRRVSPPRDLDPVAGVERAETTAAAVVVAPPQDDAPVEPRKPLIRVRDPASLGIVGRRFSDENSLQSPPPPNSVVNRMSPADGSTLCFNAAPSAENSRPSSATVADVHLHSATPSATIAAVNHHSRPSSATIAAVHLHSPIPGATVTNQRSQPTSATVAAVNHHSSSQPPSSATFADVHLHSATPSATIAAANHHCRPSSATVAAVHLHSPIPGATVTNQRSQPSSATVAAVQLHSPISGATVTNQRSQPSSATVEQVNQHSRPSSATFAAVTEPNRPPSVTIVETVENGQPANAATWQPSDNNCVGFFGATTNQMPGTQVPLALGPATRDASRESELIEAAVATHGHDLNSVAVYMAAIWSKLVQLKHNMRHLSINPDPTLHAAFRQSCYMLNRTLFTKRPIFIRTMQKLTSSLTVGRAMQLIATRVRQLRMSFSGSSVNFTMEQFACVHNLIISDSRKLFQEFIRNDAKQHANVGVPTTTAAAPLLASPNDFPRRPVPTAAAANGVYTNGYPNNQTGVTDSRNSGVNSISRVTVHVGASQLNGMRHPATNSGNYGAASNGFTVRVVNSERSNTNPPVTNIECTYANAGSGFSGFSSASSNGFAVNSSSTVGIGTNASYRKSPPPYTNGGYHPNSAVGSKGHVGISTVTSNVNHGNLLSSNGFAVNSSSTVGIGTNASCRKSPLPHTNGGCLPNSAVGRNGHVGISTVTSNVNHGNLVSSNGSVATTSNSDNGYSAPARTYARTGEPAANASDVYPAATATTQGAAFVYHAATTPATANGYHQTPVVNGNRNVGSGSTATHLNHGNNVSRNGSLGDAYSATAAATNAVNRDNTAVINRGGYTPATTNGFHANRVAHEYQEGHAASTNGNHRSTAAATRGFPMMANALSSNSTAAVGGHREIARGNDTVCGRVTANCNPYSNGPVADAALEARSSHTLGDVPRGSERHATAAFPGAPAIENEAVLGLPMPNNAVSMRLSFQTVDSNGTTSILNVVHNTIANAVDDNGSRAVPPVANRSLGVLAGASGCEPSRQTTNSGPVHVSRSNNSGRYPASAIADPHAAQAKKPLLDDRLSRTAPSSNVASTVPQSVNGFRASEPLTGIAAKAKHAHGERSRPVLSLSQEMNVDKPAAHVRAQAGRKLKSAHALEQRIEELTRKTSEVPAQGHVVIGRQGASIVEQPARARTNYQPKVNRSVSAPWMRPPSKGVTAGEKGDQVAADGGAATPDGGVRVSPAKPGHDRATVIRNCTKNGVIPLTTDLEVCIECKKRSVGLCGACKAVAYCSNECMTAHWNRIHNKECERT